MLYTFTESTTQDITDALEDVMLFLGHRDQMNAALHGDSKIKESALTQIVARALNSFGEEKRNRRIEAEAEKELKDPEQWDWNKAETKQPAEQCFDIAVHVNHDWYTDFGTIFQKLWHCPGVEKKDERQHTHFTTCFCPYPHAAHNLGGQLSTNPLRCTGK